MWVLEPVVQISFSFQVKQPRSTALIARCFYAWKLQLPVSMISLPLLGWTPPPPSSSLSDATVANSFYAIYEDNLLWFKYLLPPMVILSGRACLSSVMLFGISWGVHWTLFVNTCLICSATFKLLARWSKWQC